VRCTSCALVRCWAAAPPPLSPYGVRPRAACVSHCCLHVQNQIHRFLCLQASAEASAAAMGSRMPFRHLFTCRRAGWRRRILAAPPLWFLSASLLLISAAVLWQPGRSFQQAALQAAEDGRGGREEEGGSCPTLGTVPWGCQHLRRVCLDQGQAVLHWREYQPSQASAARPPRRLPSWSPRVDDNFPYPPEGGSNPDYLTAPGLLQPQPPLAFRPVSAAEPTPDLASPQVRQSGLTGIPFPACAMTCIHVCMPCMPCHAMPCHACGTSDA